MGDSKDRHLAPQADAVDSDDMTGLAPPNASQTQASFDDATRVVSPSKPLSIPGYEVIAELGRGGMGVVYRARDVRAERDVAIKVVLSAAHASANELARFMTEARAVAAVQHPGIVTLYVAGEHDGLPYLAMEYCPGGSLRERLGRGVMHPAESAELVADLADAVQAAHEQNVVHRDLKPANVLLTARGRPKITDFGLAKRLGGGSDLTASTAILGTPSYMSPEQAAGTIREVSPASDIYSLGAILYEALTGVPPFRGASATSILHCILNDEPVPPSRLMPGVPKTLDAICLKCLAKKPVARHVSAAALAADLRKFIAERAAEAVSPPGWAKRRRAVTIVVLVGLLFAVAVALRQWSQRAATAPSSTTRPAANASANKPAIADPNTIVDEPRGIRITVPPGWSRLSPDGFNIGSPVYYAWSDPKSSHLLIAVRKSDTDDPRALLSWMVANKTSTVGATILAQEVRTIAGLQAAWLVYRWKDPNGAADASGAPADTVDHWVIIPRNDKTTVAVFLTCEADDYDMAKSSLDSALKTLVLSPSRP